MSTKVMPANNIPLIVSAILAVITAVNTIFRSAVISYFILRYLPSPINIIFIIGFSYFFNRQLGIKFPTCLAMQPRNQHRTGIPSIDVYLGSEETKTWLREQLRIVLGFAMGGIAGVCLTVWYNARLFDFAGVLKEVVDQLDELQVKLRGYRCEG
ncbi:hypothetical protein LTR27_000780 [Elasticomyces elasticus]|nr:hypothetical protein LTR27_000780 [Elasticomyces elasticus]